MKIISKNGAVLILILTLSSCSHTSHMARTMASTSYNFHCYTETRTIDSNKVINSQKITLDLSDGQPHVIGELNGESYVAIADFDKQLLNIQLANSSAGMGGSLTYGNASLGGITEDCINGICDSTRGLAKTMSSVGCKKAQ